MAAIYAVYTSPSHPLIPNHLPTLIVTPHGQPSNILYSYLHTNFNTENYLLTPSPQGDLCVAKLFPPRPKEPGKASASDPGHGSPSTSRVVRCEASRNLKWTIANTGVISPIYKLSLPSPDSPDLPLFQISKPNPNAAFWSMFYFAYAGHNIPPKRIEFGKIQKNPPSANGGGGGTRISITGKTPEEKAVWQTLGEGNEDCVEWVVLCAALNLLDDEIIKAAEKNPPPASSQPRAPVALQDNGPVNRPPAGQPRPGQVPPPNQGLPPPAGQPRPGQGQGQGPPPSNQGLPPLQGQRLPAPNGSGPMQMPGNRPPPSGGYLNAPPPGGYQNGPPGARPFPPGQGPSPPGGFIQPGHGPQGRSGPSTQGGRLGMPPGPGPGGYGGPRPPPGNIAPSGSNPPPGNYPPQGNYLPQGVRMPQGMPPHTKKF